MNAADPRSVPRPEGWTPDHDKRWADVFARILRIEGGFVDDPDDRGGATKYGISLRFLAIEGKIDLDGDLFADFDLNRDGTVNSLDVRLLTPANAEALYLRHFFIDTGFWRLPRPFDGAMFDLGVNVGTVRAGMLLQHALNAVSPPPPLKIDGAVGPKSRLYLSAGMKGGKAVLAYLRNEAADYYREIVARNASQKKYLNGWLKRASELGRV